MFFVDVFLFNQTSDTEETFFILAEGLNFFVVGGTVGDVNVFAGCELAW